MAQSLSGVLALLAQLNAPGSGETPMPEPEMDGGEVCIYTRHTTMETHHTCYYLCEGQEETFEIPVTEDCPEQIQTQ